MPFCQRIGLSITPMPSSAFSGPLKVRMTYQAKARSASLTHSGMNSSRSSVGSDRGLTTLARK
jgi:hypothetical protein